MGYYTVCPDCGAHLDPCERCGCGGMVEAFDGGMVYEDEAVCCCGELFSSAEAANGFAAGFATEAELLSYLRENESEFGAFLAGDMEALVYDHAGSDREAGEYIGWLMRSFAAADKAFYGWLDWKRG